jgi:acyl dehydratase
VSKTRAAVPFEFDDVPALQGQRIAGEPFQIDLESRQLFEQATWLDRTYEQPLDAGFPTGMVEGFHALSMLDAVRPLAFRANEKTTYGYNYGVGTTRFIDPIIVGDTILPWFEVLSVREKGPGYVVEFQCSYEIEGRARPSMVANWFVYILPTGVTI